MNSNIKVLDFAIREELIDLIDVCLMDEGDKPNPSKYEELTSRIATSEVLMNNFRDEDLAVLAHLLPGIGQKELSPDIIWDWYRECRARAVPKPQK